MLFYCLKILCVFHVVLLGVLICVWCLFNKIVYGLSLFIYDVLGPFNIIVVYKWRLYVKEKIGMTVGSFYNL